MTKYLDVADKEEDDRIATIGRQAMTGKKVGFVTDSDPPEKVERYIQKLRDRFPSIQVVDRFAGPVPGTISVIVSIPKG